jgi:CMP-N-acetylneuraminic acid synthetase
MAASSSLADPKANHAALKRKAEAMGVNIMALIPARLNSKGLPRKNITPLNGKPLLAYSIESALGVEVFDHVIVSTDSEKIAGIAKEHGAETPFLRPPQLARDTSLLGDVETNAVEQMAQRGYHADIIVSLYPTSPFRHKALMIKLLLKLLEGYRSVHIGPSVTWDSSEIYFENEERTFVRIGNQAMLFPDKGVYRLGLFVGRWVSDRWPNWGSYVETPHAPEYFIDIDTMEDLETAERIIRNSLSGYMA